MKIGARQFTILVILVTIGDSLLVLPAIPAFEAKQDAWIAAIVGLIIGLVVIYLICTVGKLYPQLTLIQYSEKILGKWPGKMVGFLFLCYLFVSISTHTREIDDFFTTEILPNTPMMAISFLFIGIVVMAAILGLEVIARSAELFFPIFLTLFFVLIVCLTPQIELQNLQPIFEGGMKPILRGSFATTAFPFIEDVVFLMIFPNIIQAEKIKKRFIIGAMLGGIVLILFITVSILVLGPYDVANSIYPGYALSKKINIGNFIQRIEIILAVMWLLTTYIKVAFYFYIMNLGLVQIMEIKNEKNLPFALPLGLIVIVFSLLVSPHIAYIIHVISAYWPFLDGVYSVLLPLLLLFVYWLRKIFKKQDKWSS
ncbi:endospore germination permease [Fictibacillus sp. Mic-4]|uniref:GerAB/ArcD/ProY family transporter n=1 Tax=Fictibacillus sp. Mic-4 TaxID=3132826 RepID=UPI003CF81285